MRTLCSMAYMRVEHVNSIFCNITHAYSRLGPYFITVMANIVLGFHRMITLRARVILYTILLWFYYMLAYNRMIKQKC